jgi:hypothetical protein
MSEQLSLCRCGGEAEKQYPRYAFACIACKDCGIRTKERHCDEPDYYKNMANDWNKVMENNQ